MGGKRGAGEAENIFFRTTAASGVLNDCLASLKPDVLITSSVLINTFPLRHSWNSSHINTVLLLLRYSIICDYITECLCQSDRRPSQYLFYYRSYAYCCTLLTLMLVHQDWFVSLRLHLTAEDVNSNCHTAFFNSPYRIKLWFLICFESICTVK